MELAEQRAQEVAGFILRPDKEQYPAYTLAGYGFQSGSIHLFLSELETSPWAQRAGMKVQEYLAETLLRLDVDAICSVGEHSSSFSRPLSEKLGLTHLSFDPKTKQISRDDSQPINTNVDSCVIFDDMLRHGKDVFKASKDLEQTHCVYVPAIETIVNFQQFDCKEKMRELAKLAGHSVSVVSLTTFSYILRHPFFEDVFPDPKIREKIKRAFQLEQEKLF